MPEGADPLALVQVGTRNAVARVKARLTSINCGPASGQGQGEGFTNLYPL
jgi:hypothetical protein